MSRSVETPTHDDMVTFARAMHEVTWQYSTEPGELILSYFEKPHKWDTEYCQWLKFGGTLEKDCLTPFERWLDNQDIHVSDGEKTEMWQNH